MKIRNFKFALVLVTLFAIVFAGNVKPSAAAEIQHITVGCSITHATVTLTVPAPFLRINVYRASDLTTALATKVVRVYGGVGSKHRITVHYPVQTVSTHLIVAVGEWDGTKFLVPATFAGADCIQ